MTQESWKRVARRRRRVYLEGRLPSDRALDINHIETFIPAVGEAADPPIALAIIMRFARNPR